MGQEDCKLMWFERIPFAHPSEMCSYYIHEWKVEESPTSSWGQGWRVGGMELRWPSSFPHEETWDLRACASEPVDQVSCEVSPSWLGTSTEMSHRLPHMKPVSIASFSDSQITVSLCYGSWGSISPLLFIPTRFSTCLFFPLQFYATSIWNIFWFLFTFLPSYLASSFQRFLNCLWTNETPIQVKMYS